MEPADSNGLRPHHGLKTGVASWGRASLRGGSRLLEAGLWETGESQKPAGVSRGDPAEDGHPSLPLSLPKHGGVAGVP